VQIRQHLAQTRVVEFYGIGPQIDFKEKRVEQSQEAQYELAGNAKAGFLTVPNTCSANCRVVMSPGPATFQGFAISLFPLRKGDQCFRQVGNEDEFVWSVDRTDHVGSPALLV
jgi:hypothetical protein